jgi:5'-methylthioadenosine phosphorylase
VTTQLPQASLAVIGGSGLYAMPGLTDVIEVVPTTPFGAPSDAVVIGTLNGVRVAFLPRHGRGHRYLPTEVPYRANIYALKLLGVTHCISVSACGSLRIQLRPRDIVMPDQLFDFTKQRAGSFFGKGIVGHVSFAKPFADGLSELVAETVRAEGGTAHLGGTFITIEGPRFSTKAESHAFRAWGCDIIGMTASPEAALAREAEIDFAVMAHVTDYDCWHEEEEPVTVQMVIERLNANTVLAQRAITVLAPKVAALKHESAGAMQYAVMTARDRMPAETKVALAPLVGKYLA